MTAASAEPLSILVVEVTEAAHENHRNLLQHLPGVKVVCSSDPEKALQSAKGADLLIASLATTHETAAFIKHVRMAVPGVPVIAIAKERELEKEMRQAAYEAGAMTLIDQRPIDPMVYLNASRTALELAVQRREEKLRIAEANQKATAVYAELEKRELVYVEAMRNIVALADPALVERMDGVANITGMIAKQGRLPDAPRLEAVARLYDVGMLAIPPALRARRLQQRNADDEKAFQTHVTRCNDVFGEAPQGLLAIARAVACSHHERWDGNGYPAHRKGEQIPIYARIVAVAEAFYDETRPVGNRQPTLMAALQKVQRQENTAFDPAAIVGLSRVVDVMIAEQQKPRPQ